MRTIITLALMSILLQTVAPVGAQTTPVPCDSAPAPRLQALAPARVTDGGVANNLRAEPSIDAELVGQIPPGAVFNVLNRTTCTDGYLWYEVVYRGTVGWTVEGADDVYFLEPYIVEATPVSSVVDDVGSVDSDWLRLSYDPALASAVTVELSPGYTLPDSVSPHPRNARFRFEDFPGFRPDESCCQMSPLIALYPVSGFLEISDGFSAEIDALQTLLDERAPLPEYTPDEPGIDRDDDLPMLPHRNAVQVFALAPQYVDFANGAGLRYVTAYVQQLAEFDQYTLFYTFQGLTDDGATYVSAQFPLVIPADALPVYVAGDYEDMMSWYWPYFIEMVGNLKTLDGSDTTPDLSQLDAMIASMWVGTVE